MQPSVSSLDVAEPLQAPAAEYGKHVIDAQPLKQHVRWHLVLLLHPTNPPYHHAVVATRTLQIRGIGLHVSQP